MHAGYVDCQAVHVRSTSELMSQVNNLQYKDSCGVGLQGVSAVDLSSGSTVASTSPPTGSLMMTTVGDRVAGRVRRTCRPTSESTVVSRSQTSVTQSTERRRRLYCSLCRVKLNADQQAEQHYSGKLHSRKSKKLALQLNATNDPADTQVPYNRRFDRQPSQH